MARLPLFAGTEIAGYVLDARIDGGGLAEVWQAHVRATTDRRVTIEFAVDPALAAAWAATGSLPTDLDHPHVVRALAADLGHEPPWVAYERAEGESLRARLDREGAFKPHRAVALAVDVLAALAYAHRRTPPLVHGDVQPAHVRLDAEGRARLGGFATGRVACRLATELGRAASPLSGAVLQALAVSRDYLAPERSRGGEPDERGDLFAVGVMLHEMLTGDVRKLRFPIPGLPPTLSDAVEKAVEADPERRWASVREMAVALAEALQAAEGIAPPGEDTMAELVPAAQGVPAPPATPDGRKLKVLMFGLSVFSFVVWLLVALVSRSGGAMGAALAVIWGISTLLYGREVLWGAARSPRLPAKQVPLRKPAPQAPGPLTRPSAVGRALHWTVAGLCGLLSFVAFLEGVFPLMMVMFGLGVVALYLGQRSRRDRPAPELPPDDPRSLPPPGPDEPA